MTHQMRFSQSQRSLRHSNQSALSIKAKNQSDLSSKFENLNQKIIKLKLSIHLGFWESLMIRPIIFLEYLSKIIQSHVIAIWKNWVFMLGNCLILNWERALERHQVFNMLFWIYFLDSRKLEWIKIVHFIWNFC